PPGGMLSIALAAGDVQPLIDADPSSADLSIGVINTPDSCVVSGPKTAIDGFEVRLQRSSVEYRRLPFSGAGHSALMELIMAPFREFVMSLSLQPPQLPFVSNLSGTWATATEVTDPEYWIRHLRDTVRFSEGLQTLLDEPNQILLEVGPGRSLA